MTPAAPVLRDLAPNGRLRAAINFGNAALAQRDPANNEPTGISIAMAKALGERLGVPVDLVGYDAAGKVTDALAEGAWDVAFLAVDPVRAERLAFSPAYVQIAACYMVHADSPLQRSQDVDAPGLTVAVGKGAAYDLHLTRTLKYARIERRPTAAEAFALFESAPLDAAAGVRRVVERHAAQRPGLRVLADDFLAIDQAICLPRGREAGSAWLRAFVEQMKREGFVADELRKTGKQDIAVAPPAA